LIEPLSLLGREVEPRALITLARRTHFRSVSTVQPIFSTLDVIATRCESCAASYFRTNRSSRSRNNFR
jgi:hypothetical protein